MWYAKTTGKAEDKDEKKLREARQAARWIPWCAVVVLIGGAVGGVNAVRHPDVGHLLHLAFPVGAILSLLSRWREARATLTGRPETLLGRTFGTFLLGVLLMASGPSLGDMWHRRQMSWFYTLGTAVLAMTLFCLGLMILEWVGSRRSSRRS